MLKLKISSLFLTTKYSLQMFMFLINFMKIITLNNKKILKILLGTSYF